MRIISNQRHQRSIAVNLSLNLNLNMTYNIFLKRPEGTYKVSVFDSEADEAAKELSFYLFRHYPVNFCDDQLDEAGDSEKVLKDNRSGKIVWREGDRTCRLQEGYFFVEEKVQDEQAPWWRTALPHSKKQSIELDIQSAWKRGFSEGYAKGTEEGYQQKINELITN